MKKGSLIISIALSVLFFSCHTSYNPQSLEYTGYQVKQQPITDSSLVNMLRPYSTRLQASMGQVIGQVAVNLEKRQPEGTLGNVMADAMLQRARASYGKHVDAAFMNYGGIRLTQIPQGPLTLGKLYELSPFDNIVVLLSIRGNVFRQFLDHIAGRGGWPVSGMKMEISNNRSANVTIDGKPLNDDAQYTIAVLDYNANGGDDCTMLKGLPQQNNGIIFRDELQAYFTQLQKEGKSITARVEGRVIKN
ncbi:MAG TPA: 5'-nucleotidase [Chitinophagaceae bacterium]|nr:5'-nucleotidase [Chitinophagaceae bacterium]